MIRAGLLVVALLLAPIALAQFSDKSSKVAGPVLDGQEISCDLPPQEQIKNIGSKIDGAGMCVFSSIEMAARAQGLEQMRGYRDWWASVSRGGGWPEQVDKSLTAWWKHKGIEPIGYYQFEGADPAPVLATISKTGRMACLTYGWSPRYGQGIAHMVCSPGFGKYGIVLDNNFVAQRKGDSWDENIYEWMEPAELCRRCKAGSGTAWVFCWLPMPAPPPVKRSGPTPRG